MNKKILGIALTVFFLAMLTIPVMAAPATKIGGVTLTNVTPPVRTIYPGYPRIYDNGIRHVKGNTTNNVNLTIPGLGPSGSDLILEIARYSEWISKSKSIGPDPEAKAIITAKLVWTLTGGTFEGRVYRTITGLPISGSSLVYTRVVLHGTGDFRGLYGRTGYFGHHDAWQVGS